jgi:hypothetical protein
MASRIRELRPKPCPRPLECERLGEVVFAGVANEALKNFEDYRWEFKNKKPPSELSDENALRMASCK